jgi:hypothetical protein
MEASMSDVDEYERYLIEQIEAIKLEAQKQAQPFVDRLVRLRSLRPMPILFVDSAALKGNQ